MTVSVPLEFVPPTETDIVSLRVYESATPDGLFSLIDETPAGEYPTYINRYVTDSATALTDWFAISWVNTESIESPLSAPVKGNTRTLVGELANRVLLRSPDLNENVVVQEAESTIMFILGVDNPYTIDISTLTLLQLNELANLTLVATMYSTIVEASAVTEDYTAGMISERSSSSNSSAVLKNLDLLEKRSLRKLGIGGSLLVEIDRRKSCVITRINEQHKYVATRLLAAREIVERDFVVHDTVTGEIISQ